ncbi:hypothetical protein ATORI0001_0906 [Lancefieldella rimae ATCC 49626]|uniref:Uncharacterized protein n=1 Tax=Lancefieldella rimae (strain ATCC 49626 / DSM 7090 / CCUG 31168 / NBRC 15546 / VPI D140H-11A) TaxID=553184 RepID=B9CMU6_LANR4|nr:hypothetical protein ATORI0001_0906 [Lancefieldella rimae ATCC 49626]
MGLFTLVNSHTEPIKDPATPPTKTIRKSIITTPFSSISE